MDNLVVNGSMLNKVQLNYTSFKTPICETMRLLSINFNFCSVKDLLVFFIVKKCFYYLFILYIFVHQFTKNLGTIKISV